MNIPEINKSNIKSYLDKSELVNQTANQIIKDFALFGMDICFSGDIQSAYQELHKQLVEQITYLIEINSHKLFSVLYQIDINENKLMNVQKDFPEYDHVELIAHEIIARELKKVLIRNYFKNSQ